MKYDIVYILKNNIESDEIRYSVRSVVKNFPYNKIWFYGGCPNGIVPDKYVNYMQRGNSKWKRSTETLAEICKNNEITENFWLFNDDFFVMKRIRSQKPLVGGTILQKCKRIEERHGGMQTGYTRQMRRTAHVLKINGYPQLDYALHVPMLINRKKALEVLNAFPDSAMFRSLYGNYCSLEGIKADDVKISNNDIKPDEDARLLSTDDASFSNGEVGKYIRETFPEPCKYEV